MAMVEIKHEETKTPYGDTLRTIYVQAEEERNRITKNIIDQIIRILPIQLEACARSGQLYGEFPLTSMIAWTGYVKERAMCASNFHKQLQTALENWAKENNIKFRVDSYTSYDSISYIFDFDNQEDTSSTDDEDSCEDVIYGSCVSGKDLHNQF